VSTNGHNGRNGHTPTNGIEVLYGPRAPENTEPIKLPPPSPGLVECNLCHTMAAPRSGHLAVHFAKGSIRPCERSWPPKPVTPAPAKK
jgi:hypothetical protein